MREEDSYDISNHFYVASFDDMDSDDKYLNETISQPTTN